VIPPSPNHDRNLLGWSHRSRSITYPRIMPSLRRRPRQGRPNVGTRIQFESAFVERAPPSLVLSAVSVEWAGVIRCIVPRGTQAEACRSREIPNSHKADAKLRRDIHLWRFDPSMTGHLSLPNSLLERLPALHRASVTRRSLEALAMPSALLRQPPAEHERSGPPSRRRAGAQCN
jgi:hypothetical protein